MTAKRESLRLRLYRSTLCRLAESLVLPRFFGTQRMNISELERVPPRGSSKTARYWFHAASVGELESIWTVIESVARKGQAELIVTVFSESAERAISRLKTEVTALCGDKLLYAGYSPWEGRWAEILERARPDRFVTAKYESWPDLWATLSQQKIPLTIVGAQDRSSLRSGVRMLKLLGFEPPGHQFLAIRSEDAELLKKRYPQAVTIVTGDPRWDRVLARTKTGNPRARELIASFQDRARPWGVFGSVWLSDLNFLAETLKEFPGTIWFVPHHVDDSTVTGLQAKLTRLGISSLRTSELPSASTEAKGMAIIVNEMGFLSELYAAADWAYVGGGFEAGVHSTIEPAIQGLPILIGPKNASKFPEIAQLQKAGQLTVAGSASQLESWVSLRLFTKSAQWKKDADSRLGATQRVLAALEMPC